MFSCRFVRFAFLLLAIISFHDGIRAQPNRPSNRFQYQAQQWRCLPGASFHLYYPEGCDSLASFASVHLPDIMEACYKASGLRLTASPHLILYPGLVSLYASNIGIVQDSMPVFPTLQAKGMRAVLAFEGSYERFRDQLSEVWAAWLWQQVLGNGPLIGQGPPDWFRKGAVQYIANGWRPAHEAALGEWFAQGEAYRDFKDLTEQRPGLAGQAFCYYLSIKYREDALRQLVVQLRSGKSLARALRLVTKRDASSLYADGFAFFKERYKDLPESKLWSGPPPPGKGAAIISVSYPVDSQKVALVVERFPYRDVYVWELPCRACPPEPAGTWPKRSLRYRLPAWTGQDKPDPYPLLQWQGDRLDALLPHKGKLELRRFQKGGLADRYVLYGVEGVEGFLPLTQDRYLLTAQRKGQSAIVMYDARRSHYRLLDGAAGDHTELAYEAATGTLAYRSGYPVDSVYHKKDKSLPYGIYSKDWRPQAATAPAGGVLWLADSAYGEWHNPIPGKEGWSVLGTRTGFPERISIREAEDPNERPLFAWAQEYERRKRRADSIQALLDKGREQDDELLGAILVPEGAALAAEQMRDSLRRAMAYVPAKSRPYVLRLYQAYFSGQVNNDYFMNRYQPYGAYMGAFKFPELGALAIAGLGDLFDDHQWRVGFRMPAGNEGSDFLIGYQNLSRRLDWDLSLFRKVETLPPDALRDWKDAEGRPYPPAAKVRTYYASLGFHYPLDEDWSLLGHLAGRRDQTIFLATDRYSLEYPSLFSFWTMGHMGLKADKKRPLGAGLFQGGDASWLVDMMASSGKQGTWALGLQWQGSWHQSLWRRINVVAGGKVGTSQGPSRILYNFGGVDNNLVPRVDTSVRFPQDAPIAFQTLVAPLRGYPQNTLYGSGYALFNVDIYVPLFDGVIAWRPRFQALAHLQPGLFLDKAWVHGMDVLKAPVSERMAFGYSLRTRLAGYPLRFDMAWPGTFQEAPIWYFSLSL